MKKFISKCNSNNILYGAIWFLVGVTTISLFFILFVYKSFSSDLSKVEYVSFNDEKVDTIYTVIGKRKVCSYSSDLANGRYEIVYCDGALTTNDMLNYTAYLMGIGYKGTKDKNGNIWYVKETTGYNKVISVFVGEDNKTLIYEKGDGYVDEYDTENDTGYM